MPKKQKWVTINDDNIRHIWECPECSKKVTISPAWYTDNGTPTCECDTDMRYLRTETRK